MSRFYSLSTFVGKRTLSLPICNLKRMGHQRQRLTIPIFRGAFLAFQLLGWEATPVFWRPSSVCSNSLSAGYVLVAQQASNRSRTQGSYLVLLRWQFLFLAKYMYEAAHLEHGDSETHMLALLPDAVPVAGCLSPCVVVSDQDLKLHVESTQNLHPINRCIERQGTQTRVPHRALKSSSERLS